MPTCIAVEAATESLGRTMPTFSQVSAGPHKCTCTMYHTMYHIINVHADGYTHNVPHSGTNRASCAPDLCLLS